MLTLSLFKLQHPYAHIFLCASENYPFSGLDIRSSAKTFICSYQKVWELKHF